MTPRMLRLASGLALLVSTLFLPLEYLYGSGEYFSRRLAAHGVHAGLSGIGIAASFLALSSRTIDRLLVAIVLSMGANALIYVAVTPGYPALLANALALLLFGATVICAWSPVRTAIIGTCFAQGFMLVGLFAHHRNEMAQDHFIFAIGALLLATVIA